MYHLYTDQYQMAMQVCILKRIHHIIMALVMSIYYQLSLSHLQLLQKNLCMRGFSRLCFALSDVHSQQLIAEVHTVQMIMSDNHV